MAKKATSRKSAAKPLKSTGAAKITARPTKEKKRSRAQDSTLGARPIWSGNIRLALVLVPVKIYPATKAGARISFHQVHKPSGKRINYQKIVAGVGPVENEDIVKGYEIDKGRYVLFEPEEIDEVKLESRRTLDLVQFVQQGEIDPIWFDTPYYVVPDGELAEEAYAVLRDGLSTKKRIGLGQFVMRGREYVAALKPFGKGILLETLRFADEVRQAKPFFEGIAEEDSDPDLLSMAEELIQRKSGKFDPDRFHDTYTETLRELIEKKARTGKPLEIEETSEQPTGRGAQVIDLVEALKRSVRGGGGEERASTRRSASERRKAG
ncbi:MAG TPA: Ku protein [Kiloniellales bacterium]|nr:Ku protein [Kiloniellales bacterium]